MGASTGSAYLVGRAFPRNSRFIALGCLILAAFGLLLLAHQRPEHLTTVRQYIAGGCPDHSYYDADELTFGTATAAAASSPAARQCSADSEIDRMDERWGSLGLDMSVAHAGSALRVRRVIQKIQRGEKVVIGAVGGSITYGRNLKPENDPWPWSRLLEKNLKEFFPDADITVQNGGVPATGTDYFAYCYHLHVNHDADLIIIEEAVNDLSINGNAVQAETDLRARQQRENAVTYNSEVLVRNILRQREDNAVMMLSLWIKTQDYINGADSHAIVAEYYDIPRISHRPYLYRYLMQNPDQVTTHYLLPDFGHQTQLNHQYMADSLYRFILQQVCYLEKHGAALPEDALKGSMMERVIDPWPVPPRGIFQRIDSDLKPEVEPFCLSANAKREGKPLLWPSSVDGFTNVTIHDKSYWQSDKPGSTVTFSDLESHAGGLSIYYKRSNKDMGDMLCWVDDNKDKAVTLIGFWQYVTVGYSMPVRTDLNQGKHSLTCEVLETTHDPAGGTLVQIIAIMGT